MTVQTITRKLAFCPVRSNGNTILKNRTVIWPFLEGSIQSPSQGILGLSFPSTESRVG